MKNAKLADTTPLGNAQRLFWLGQAMYPDAPLYNMAIRFDIQGALNPELFEQAHVCLQREFDVLRAVIEVDADGQPVMRTVVPERADTLLRQVDLSKTHDAEHNDTEHHDAEYAGVELKRDIERVISRAFELERATTRSVLYKLSEHRWTWLLCQHHTITDVTSFALLYHRLGELYAAIRVSGGEGIDVSESSQPSYAEFLAAEQKPVGADRARLSASYWRDKLARAAPAPALLKSLHSSPRSRRFDLPLDQSSIDKLNQMIEAERFALTASQGRFAVLAAAVAVWLWRLDRDYDVVRIGFPVHGRSDRLSRQTAGLLMESIFIDVCPQAHTSFSDLVRSVVLEVNESLRNTHTGVSQKELLQGAHVYLNYLNVQFADFAGLKVESHWLHTGFADPQHPLRLQVHDFDGEGLQLQLDCNVQALPEAHGQPMRAALVEVLRSVGRDSKQSVAEISLQETPSKDNQPRFEEVPDLLKRWHQAVDRHGDDIALESGEIQFTYRDAALRVATIAHRLRDCAIEPGQPIVLIASRSVAQVIATLAVLQANGAWVPVESTMPSKRINAILESVESSSDRPSVLLIAEDTVLDEAVNTDNYTIVRFSIQDSGNGSPVSTPSDRDFAASSPDQRAYVMFTSGSTGEPKGVEISRFSLSHYLLYAEQTYLRGEVMSFASVSPPTFDLGITTTLLPLLSGNRLIVYAGESPTDADSARSIDSAFLEAVRDRRAAFMKLTPSQLAIVDDNDVRYSALRRLVVGGEDFPTSLARRLHELKPDLEIYNEYGPTETTVGCTSHRFDPIGDSGSSVPIGRAIAGTSIELVDRCLRPIPSGMTGEILIGGVGVAQGYLNQSAMTAERFVVDHTSGRVVYRSGDLGRIDENACLHYLGRSDRQLKIRGVRIEPAEIESEIRQFESIADSVVLALRPTRSEPIVSKDRSHARRCSRCGIEQSHPAVEFEEIDAVDGGDVCKLCLSYDAMRDRVSSYFGNDEDFEAIAENMRAAGAHSQLDCVALLSGGKDSSYMLYRLVSFGLKPLALTLDNGFISEQAKSNIDRIVSDLGVEHVYVQTPHMDAIFVDSLRRFSNVCQGCFKTIYTLATQVAMQRGISHVITGLSRGQLFETRLHELYRRDEFSASDYDEKIESARRVYHRMDDVVFRTVGCDVFTSNDVFDQVRFVDFYRYIDVGLDEVMSFLDTHAPWVRPSDTGRSTNCLINDAGIYVHRKERGFHNYALPYSWDVRLGHKTRSAALSELDDRIEPHVVEPILRKIGYHAGLGSDDRQLTAFYTVDSADLAVDSSTDETPSSEDAVDAIAGVNIDLLREHLSSRLPAGQVPVRFIRLPAIPQTSNGKVDVEALQRQSTRADGSSVALDSTPLDEDATSLLTIYRDVLGYTNIDPDQTFFSMGGDSLSAIRIAERAQLAGFDLVPLAILEGSSIRKLARSCRRPKSDNASEIDSRPHALVDAVVAGGEEQKSAVDDLIGVDDLEAIAARFRSDA